MSSADTPTEIQPYQQSVVYQIYPRSFADSNGDGVGDLPGITSRLPYVAKLGVDTIWLSPIFASPNDDNGYDISDYRAIMPEFGTMEDFEQLLETAHSLGLKIMLDLVVNHSSDEHEWFKQARSSRENPYRDYYIWRDPAGFAEDGTPLPPNNWISFFSPSVWEWDEHTQQFYLHYFSVKQPDLNWENPRVREEVYDIMRFWLDKGVDGFRMDVINLISKPEDFGDDPAIAAGSTTVPLERIANGPRIHEFLQEMNREVLSHYPGVMTVGETPGVSTADAALYTGFDRHEVQMVFQFEHMDVDASKEGHGRWSEDRFSLVELKSILSRWQHDLQGRGWNSLYWNNHDQPRAVSRFGNDSAQYRVKSAKLLASVLHGMQGTPYIYQGEELGMTNVFFDDIARYNDLEIHDAWRKYVDSGEIDPETMLRYISASGRDNARTPVQWDASAHAGFTTGTPWLEVNPRFSEINAQAALEDSDSVFYSYRDVIAARKAHPIFATGAYAQLPGTEEDPALFAYVRMNSEADAAASGERALLVLANFSDEPYEFAAAEGNLSSYAQYAGLKNPQLLLANYPEAERTEGVLAPWESRLYLYSL
ncbi:MAG: alpha-glucosidase [Rothia sp. (in: high G+C Gram-positive bacteria)]|uniref:glycoside hydrolase family 13 protein n=1 Tax=Rothia sp. (in: high G+C Gram-positive bacteria) TaxID=1885016 RepID=UPI0026E0E1D0|nr:alpha-glucosidase [Rothia sp. (in: high G+C Gram-positive bacteria)]MDO5750013.1 alpha-glucosidase [Rothia sp. (in: high G+C Gram-positive bacteria)]